MLAPSINFLPFNCALEVGSFNVRSIALLPNQQFCGIEALVAIGNCTRERAPLMGVAVDVLWATSHANSRERFAMLSWHKVSTCS